MSAVVKFPVTMLDLLMLVGIHPEFTDIQRIASALVDAGLDVSSLDSVRTRAVMRGFVDLRFKGGDGRATRVYLSLTKHGAEELERLQHAKRTRVAHACTNAAMDDILAEMGVT